MTYKDWKYWVRSLPWSMRWFVILILLRPIIDVFYFLKEISPFLSPLYIVGVMTPVLIVASFTAKTFPRKPPSTVDIFLIVWGCMLVISAIMVVLIELNAQTLEIGVKLVTPVLIYFFVRHFMRTKRDLVGILTTFLYSAIFPFGMLLYERIIAPIGPLVETRGFTRYEGLYADVMSYAIYVIGSLLIACYFLLDEESKEPFRRRARRLIVVSGLAVLGLISMQHTASWAVATSVVGLLFLHSFGKRQMPAMLFLLAIGVSAYLIVGQEIGARVSGALETDLAVLEGEKDIGRAFHGRMTRWTIYLDAWDAMPAMDKALGVSLSSETPRINMLGSGVHNDFMRVMFTTGILGLFAYLGFYFAIFVKSFQAKKADRFLIWGAMGVMMLYSVTTTPTLYFPLLYLCLTVFAFALMPRRAWQPRRVPQGVPRGRPQMLTPPYPP